jgi:hypothetical protein
MPTEIPNPVNNVSLWIMLMAIQLPALNLLLPLGFLDNLIIIVILASVAPTINAACALNPGILQANRSLQSGDEPPVEGREVWRRCGICFMVSLAIGAVVRRHGLSGFGEEIGGMVCYRTG